MMQGKQSIWKRISDRGYYIALGVCVAAVAVSGWLFVRSLRADEEPAPVNYGTQTVMSADEAIDALASPRLIAPTWKSYSL